MSTVPFNEMPRASGGLVQIGSKEDLIRQRLEEERRRLEKEAGKNAGAEVQLAFRLAYGRGPDAQEFKGAEALVSQYGLEMLCRAIFNSNEFLFVE